MRRILDKRGDLTNNTLMIIVAAIGIGLLVFGVAKLWGIYANNEEKNAQTILDSVLAKVEALGEGESNEFSFQGFDGGENWILVGWGVEDKSPPDKCFPDGCLCVCKVEGEWDHVDLQKKACDETGFCKRLDYEGVKAITRGWWSNWVVLEGSVFELRIGKGPIDNFEDLDFEGYDDVKENSIKIWDISMLV